MFMPRSMVTFCRAPRTQAGFWRTFSFWVSISIKAAPARSSRMSMPQTAAVTSPTGHSSEKRPPTPSGTMKVVRFSCLAILMRFPFSLSVVAMRCREMSSPTAFLRRSTAISS